MIGACGTWGRTVNSCKKKGNHSWFHIPTTKVTKKDLRTNPQVD